MALNIFDRRKFLPLVYLLISCFQQDVYGTGQIEIQFQKYTDSCREDWNTNKCDPKFTFCLGRPSNLLNVDSNFCQYRLTAETGHWQDTNVIDFYSDMKGVPNPMIVTVDRFHDTSVRLAVKVRDDDIFEDDYLTTLTSRLQPVAASKEDSTWTNAYMTSDSYSMTFKYRLFCDAYYYTTSCDVYCKPQDSNSGHYTCNPSTGSKICMKGWQGQNCDQDINECEQKFCVRGECQNLPGDVKCICPVYYTGKDCSQLMDACQSSPCLNGGSCFRSPLKYSYVCSCVDGWEGFNCDHTLDPCGKSPCANGGSCRVMPNGTSYECSCTYPYYGANCLLSYTPPPPTPSTTMEPTGRTTVISIAKSVTSNQPTSVSELVNKSLNSTSDLITTGSPTVLNEQLVTENKPASGLDTPKMSETTVQLITTFGASRSSEHEATGVMIDNKIGSTTAGEPAHFSTSSYPEPSEETVSFSSKGLEQQQSEEFPTWVFAIVAAVVGAVLFIILVACFVIRRRRNKNAFKEGLPTGTLSGSNLVFENNMYHNANRSNLAIEKYSKDSTARPISVVTEANPAYAEVDETRVHAYGYAKIEEKLKRASVDCEVKCVQENQVTEHEKTRMNNYADFNTLRNQATVSSNDTGQIDPLYQDLDSVSSGDDLPTFRANSNHSVDLPCQDNKMMKGITSDYDSPVSSTQSAPRGQRSLPPVPLSKACPDAGYDVPKSNKLDEVCDSTDDEDDDKEDLPEDVAQLRKEVELQIKLPIVLQRRGESST